MFSDIRDAWGESMTVKSNNRPAVEHFNSNKSSCSEIIEHILHCPECSKVLYTKFSCNLNQNDNSRAITQWCHNNKDTLNVLLMGIALIIIMKLVN